MKRPEIEALYRRYFTEIRKFEPFPMTVNFENVIDFVEWLDSRFNSNVEEVSARVHETWMESKRARGVTSRFAQTVVLVGGRPTLIYASLYDDGRFQISPPHRSNGRSRNE